MNADAVGNKIIAPAERAAAAQGIFGKGAKELSALIEAGTAAIIEQGDAAAATGAIISTDTAAALDEAGDALKAFSDSWAALKLQMVGAFVPALAWTMNALSDQRATGCGDDGRGGQGCDRTGQDRGHPVGGAEQSVSRKATAAGPGSLTI